jgi:hypothetical protein
MEYFEVRNDDDVMNHSTRMYFMESFPALNKIFHDDISLSDYYVNNCSSNEDIKDDALNISFGGEFDCHIRDFKFKMVCSPELYFKLHNDASDEEYNSLINNITEEDTVFHFEDYILNPMSILRKLELYLPIQKFLYPFDTSKMTENEYQFFIHQFENKSQPWFLNLYSHAMFNLSKKVDVNNLSESYRNLLDIHPRCGNIME